jgi:hypothetical protein
VNVAPKLPNIKMPGQPSSPSVVADNKTEAKTVSEGDPLKTIESQMEFGSGAFGATGFEQLVPFEADLYMEVSDAQWALTNKSFFGDELTALIGGLDTPFCAFAYEDDAGDIIWTFLFNSPENVDIEDLFSKLPSDYWSYKIVAEKVVVSGREEVFDMVSDSAEGLTKNYSMNPFYARAVASAAKDGQILIIMSGYEGKKILESLAQMEDWKDIAPLVARVLDLGYNEVVIR